MWYNIIVTVRKDNKDNVVISQVYVVDAIILILSNTSANIVTIISFKSTNLFSIFDIISLSLW